MDRLTEYIIKNKKTLLIVVILFLLTISVRVFLMFGTLQQPASPQLINTNGEVARNIIEGKGLVINGNNLQLISQKEKIENRLINPEEITILPEDLVSYQQFYGDEVGYPIFLSLIWRLIGKKDYIFPILFQIILAGLASICVFLMAKKLMPYKYAVFSGFLYAIYILEAKLVTLPHQHAWIGLIAVFSTWLLMKINNEKSKRSIYFLIPLLGLIYGIGILMRSTLIFLPIIAVLVFFVLFRFKQALKLTLLMLVFTSLVIAPYYLYNTSHFEEQRIVRRTFWHTVAVGLGQFPNPWGFLATDGSIGDFVEKNDPELLSPVYPNTRSEQFLKNEIIKEISKNPMWYFGTIIERIPKAILPFHWAMTQGSIEPRRQNDTRIFYPAPYDTKVLFATFLLNIWITIALIGMYLMRRKWFLILPLLGIWLYFIGVYSLIFVQLGYIYPIGFVYAIFSSYSLYKFKTICDQKLNKSKQNARN